jgi:MFS family permease
MTVPCYMFASICCIVFTLLSDRYKTRGLFLVITPVLAIIGYIIVLADDGLAPGYVAMFLIAGGIYGYLSLCLTWITNNLAPDYKRAVGLPLFIGLGNIGGIVSSNLYPTSDAPRYRMGLSSKSISDWSQRIIH